ncbi:stage III sporulation protein AF [Paenibacillus sp. BR2-3]|uniref:stage III sporulation protein AF n=1 Tax=Paenibacillus sp. BR2-3 TaxID=3048494 RepID=UPI0039779D43
MTWLGGWLREIILVVLLASFVEMLLPSKSMERYARLVLSLLVLLTMLSPIVSLLKGDAVTELSMAMDQQKLQSGVLTSAGQGADTLEKILADGQRLAQGRQEQSLKLAASEIAGQMKEQISAETGERGVQVTVALAMKQADTPGAEAHPAISSVIVAMPVIKGLDGTKDTSSEDGGVTGGGTAASGPIVIPPVNSIEINIQNSEPEDQEGTGTAGASTAAGTEAGTEDAEESATAAEDVKAIKALLEQKWGLEPGVIQVQSSAAGAAKL